MTETQQLTNSIVVLNNLLARQLDLLQFQLPQFLTIEELCERYKLQRKYIDAAIERTGATVINTGRIRRIHLDDVRRIDIYMRGQSGRLDSNATPPRSRRAGSSK